ncbi:MAG: DNA-binding protein WhiA [Oscillospiraceae bacterium]|jgi:DNA-binding protein WhiA|nr:DNA-binding protein WhiA [Oscillospiraceae bacterium]
MSFSSDVKNEIANIEQTELAECCQKAEEYGLLLFGRSFAPSSISILTENAVVAQKYIAAVVRVTGKEPVYLCSKSGKHTVSVRDAQQKKSLLAEFGHDGREVGLRINYANFADDCCRAAFIRGVFLACGTVTSPEKEYHLEFSVPYINLSRDLVKIFDAFLDLAPKISERGGVQIVYFKDSSMIEDVLTLMGAGGASMELMNVKIYKEIRNNVNRKVNFESANIDRAVRAAYVQIQAIKKIEKRRGLQALPGELRELALLRLENPEMSLSELGRALREPASRSAVNHRLMKLIRMAEKL